MLVLLGAAVLFWGGMLPAGSARGQSPEEAPIFQRFQSELELPNTQQFLVEVPLSVQPQTQRDAKIIENGGLHLNRAARPLNRIYVSQGFNFTKLEWEPTEPGVDTVRVLAFDITQQLNFSIRRLFVIGLGLGLGLMDGLILLPDKDFETRLEPYIPLHLFLGLPIGDSAMVGVKAAQLSFWGPGTTVSALRVLVGVGINY